jgi:hypothetical protein
VHQEAHLIHIVLIDYLDHINIDRDFLEVLSLTKITTPDSNLAQKVIKEQKQQVFYRIDPGQLDQLLTHLYLAVDHHPDPTLEIILDIDSLGRFVSSLVVAHRGI